MLAQMCPLCFALFLYGLEFDLHPQSRHDQDQRSWKNPELYLQSILIIRTVARESKI